MSEPTRTTVHVLRHGEVHNPGKILYGRLPDFHLSELGVQMAKGGRLTLWSGTDDARGDAELAAILAQFGPILAERQIAMNHQTCEANEASGVRHAAPARPSDADLEFEEFA